jgi:hypothetical protein
MNANQGFINQVYQEVLHRIAGPVGLASLEEHFNQGMSQTQVAAEDARFVRNAH